MELKKNSTIVTVSTTKKVSDISVSLTVNFEGLSSFCLKKISASCYNTASENELSKGSEEAALAYALYETIRDKLSGSALEIYKTKVSNVSCFSIDEKLVVRWNTQGTVTALRKSCGLVASCLHPAKLFTKYTDNIRFLGGKPNKEVFNYCAKKLSENIKKNIHFLAVGKINITKEKLNDVVMAINKKLPDMDIPSAKEIEAPPKREKTEMKYPIIKSSGLSAAILADYIRSSSNGMSVEVTDNGVMIYNNLWETKKTQLKQSDRIKDYIDKKYVRLDDEFIPIFTYFMMMQSYADGITLSKNINAKIKPNKLVELIKKSL
jgi:hypothetical protein